MERQQLKKSQANNHPAHVETREGHDATRRLIDSVASPDGQVVTFIEDG